MTAISLPAGGSVLPVTLADRLQWILDHRGISASKLSTQAGMSRAYVRKLMEREPIRPDYSALEKIAGAAKVSAAWLIRDQGSPEADAPAFVPSEYQHTDAPLLRNIPGWADLVAAAMALDDARGVAPWAFELLGYSNGLFTIPLVPGSVVDLAKVVMRHVSPADAEKQLTELRAGRAA